MSPPVRVLALWSPDWPVTAAARAAHVPPHLPAAVVAGHRVLACSALARTHGVRRGLRRREAQARCPELVVLTPDPDRDARAFEPVVVAVEELAPGVEVVRPGLIALPARGPVGWFGGEQAAAERLVDQVSARTGVEAQVGVADGLFAAVLAARRGLAVATGRTPQFLAPLGVEELDREPDVDRSELIDLLRRLGLRSLGAFGALDADDVASRFGADAVLGHRLARGLDPRPPLRRRPPEELAVGIELDPPVDRVDAAAFAARGLAARLHRTLAGHGLSCTRLGIAARTVAGEDLLRVWRCAEPLTPSGTVDRVRWQLDAWLTARRGSDDDGSGGDGSGVRELHLVPEETVTAGALQLGLWGGTGEADARAGRAMVRVQALLGPDAAVTAVLVGGRDPRERVRLVPWGEDRDPDPPPPPRKLRRTTPPDARSGGGPGQLVDGPLVDGRFGGARLGSDPLLGSDQVVGSDPLLGSDQVVGESEGGAGGLWVGRPGCDGNRVAPAGWPDDVVRATGRVSVVPTSGPPPAAARRQAPGRSRTPAPPPEPPPPWPGAAPVPSPATVPPTPLPAVVTGGDGTPVGLAAPDLLTAPPHHVLVDGGPARPVEGWAGPWPLHQRWWAGGDPVRSRLQVVLDDGAALLLAGDGETWWVLGVYD